MADELRQSELGHDVFRRRFTVEVVWAQPPDQEHADDWGAVLSHALLDDGKPCIWGIDEGPLERLTEASDA